VTGFVPAIVQVKPVLHFLKLLWERVLLAFSFDVLSLPQNGESSASVFYSFKKNLMLPNCNIVCETILFSAFMGLAYSS